MSPEYPAGDENNNRNKQLFGCVAMNPERELGAGGRDPGGPTESASARPRTWIPLFGDMVEETVPPADTTSTQSALVSAVTSYRKSLQECD